MELSRPDTPLLKLLSLVIAALAGWWTWYALGTRNTDPDAVRDALPSAMAFEHLEKVELGWVGESFSEELVYAPLGPLPCSAGLSSSSGSRPVVAAARRALELARADQTAAALDLLTPYARGKRDQWLAHLVVGQLQLQAGRMDFAVETFDRWLAGKHDDFSSLRGKIERGSASASERRIFEGFLSLYHASGQARLRQRMTDEGLWFALRHAIGACSSWVKGAGLGMVSREPCIVEQRLAAPGCEDAVISSYDLYNNLLIGYLQDRHYRATDEGRRREFRRGRTPAPEANPLAAVLETAREGWTAAHASREHWWFALSNAESLLRGNGQRAPEHAHLSFHLAQLLEAARRVAPAAAQPPLLRQRDELIRAARRNLPSVAPLGDRSRLARGLARLEWIAAIRDGADLAPRADAGSLTAEQRRVGTALRAGLALRRDRAAFALRVLAEDGDGEFAAALGERASGWLRAARRDLAAALAEVDADLAYGVLEAGDGIPAGLRGRGGWGNRLYALRGSSGGVAVLAGSAVIVAAIVLVLGLWLALQIRHRKELFTSFYRREARARMEGP